MNAQLAVGCCYVISYVLYTAGGCYQVLNSDMGFPDMQAFFEYYDILITSKAER